MQINKIIDKQEISQDIIRALSHSCRQPIHYETASPFKHFLDKLPLSWCFVTEI